MTNQEAAEEHVAKNGNTYNGLKVGNIRKADFLAGADYYEENILPEELNKFGLWLSGQGYDKPDGIEYKVEIRGEVYSMENAVKMYLKSI